MNSFGPVGSLPVAAVPSGPGGTNITPAPGALVFSGSVPTVAASTTPVRMTGVNVEVLMPIGGSPIAHMTGVNVEILRSIAFVPPDEGDQFWLIM